MVARMRTLLVLATLALLPAARSLADASLSFSTIFKTLSPGDVFSDDLQLLSTQPSIAGLDYRLKATAGLVLVGRDVSTSGFTDVLQTDAQIPLGVALTSNGTGDLGAVTADVFNPVGPGTTLVARYTFSVPLGTTPGTYTLQTFSDPGTGFVTGAPSFADTPFTAHALLTFDVRAVPEPACLAMVVAVAMALTRRSRMIRRTTFALLLAFTAFGVQAAPQLIMNTGTTVSWLAHAQTNSVGLDENDNGFDQPNPSVVQGTQNYTYVGTVNFSSAAQNYPNASGYTIQFNAPNPNAINVQVGGMFSGLSNIQRVGNLYTANFSVFHDNGNVLAGNGGLNVAGASVANPVTNLKIIAPGGTANPGGLTPQFANRFNLYAGGRFMNNSNINNNVTPLSSADLVPAGQNINTVGNALIDQIGWINANPNAKTMFVNLPFNADKTYVQAAATLVKNNLKPGVNVLWETGNEPWNFAFSHGGWELQQANADSTHSYVNGDTYGKVGEFYGILSATKMQWVQQVIPTAKGFLNSQGANQWFVDQAKNAINRNFGGGAVSSLFQAQGISYYPTDNLAAYPGSTTGLVAAVQSDINRQHQYLANDVADAHASGLKEFVYETSVMGFLTQSGINVPQADAFLADVRSGQLTTQMLNDFTAQLTQPGEGAAWFTQQGDYWGGVPNPLASPTQVQIALDNWAIANGVTTPEPSVFGLIGMVVFGLLSRRPKVCA